MSQGGCLFIPSYYWFQSEINRPENMQSSAETTFVTFEFESGSQLVEELMGALDKGVLTQ